MIGIAIFFIILGILIKHGKMYFLIAGYNTMPSEKRAKYDIKGIATEFRNTFFAMALIILAGYFAAEWLNNSTFKGVGLYGAILVGIPYLLFRFNSDKYKMDKN